MIETNPKPQPRHSPVLLVLAFLIGAALLIGIGALLINISTRKGEAAESALKLVEVKDGETDPAVWGQNFPREYDRFMLTKDDTVNTPYGGSLKYSKLDRYPAMRRIWNGYAFAVDFNEERGHFYSLIDQKETKRQVAVKQPGACANCHSGDAPSLIKSMGWEAFNHTPYQEISSTLHSGITCNDCHDPATMALRLTRPALINALQKRGIDWTQATRQEMRTLVCAQCHVEYYFQGDNKLLTFPWEKGTNIDNINEYYDGYGFKDWAHKETGAPMLKMQHPEYELYTTGLHYSSGVACADCHMPYIREGSTKISDHWIRSPLTNVNNACQSCHKQDEAALKQRILTIQNRTAVQLRETETALLAAIDAINAALKAGATDDPLKEARDFQRKASMRWDFISSENSTGFHSPQEAARVLGDALNFARMAQLSAERVTARITGKPGDAPLLTISPAVTGTLPSTTPVPK